MSRALAALVAILWTTAPLAAGEKVKKPKLELRSSPRHGFSPLTVLFTAELKGGDDIEEYYCPEIEWDWADGGKSVQESDCEPFEPGTKIERRFTRSHRFRRAGAYNVKVTLRHAERKLTHRTVRVDVKPGIGDPGYD